MREHIPDGAEEGFAFLVKNAGPSGVEIRLTQHEGHWYALSKQRDVSDLGDPFQSVGDAYQPKYVKLRETDDKEGIDKLRETRGQEIEKLVPLLPVLGAAAGVAAQGIGDAAQTVMDVGGEAARDDFQEQYNPEIGIEEPSTPQDRGVISIDDNLEREVDDTDVSKPGDIDTAREKIERKQYKNLGLDKYHPEDDFNTDTEIEKDLTITLPWKKKKEPEGTKGPERPPGDWVDYESPTVDRHGRRITKPVSPIDRTIQPKQPSRPGGTITPRKEGEL